MSVSVLVLTYNEAVNLPDCLRSVSWADDVVVLDSFSTDGTVDIARALNARVVQRAFDDYASQRNYGLQQIRYANSWVLMLDADERVPPDLRDEILSKVPTVAAEVCLLRMRRRDHLFGRWIRRSSGYPTWFPRVARIGRVHAERPYNEEIKTDGETAALECHLDHYPFNKGFHEWILKHDRYSTMEASWRRRDGSDPWRWRDVFASEPARRRVALKGMLNALPMRPFVVFTALYFGRGGFIEGRPGLTFCLLRAWYEFMIDCKFRELDRRARGLAV
jgi:glycosyltransferase involved in cell wall biosynthesis